MFSSFMHTAHIMQSVDSCDYSKPIYTICNICHCIARYVRMTMDCQPIYDITVTTIITVQIIEI